MIGYQIIDFDSPCIRLMFLICLVYLNCQSNLNLLKIIVFLKLKIFNMFKGIRASSFVSDTFSLINQQMIISSTQSLIGSYAPMETFRCLALCVDDPNCVMASITDNNMCQLYSCVNVDFSVSTSTNIYKKFDFKLIDSFTYLIV